MYTSEQRFEMYCQFKLKEIHAYARYLHYFE